MKKISNFLRAGLSKSALLLLLCASLTACALFERKAQDPEPQPLTSRVFYAPYEEVWRATQLATAKYFMSINNIETGQIETDYIDSTAGWQSPGKEELVSSGLKYKISIRVVRGKVRGRPAVRVTATKKMELQRDFFADKEALPSDGLEESVILYRIERELLVEMALKRAQNKSS